ncbi:MAG: cell division protein ZapA [Oscillospiraceae bacterium]|nr:cell division protein ZapA [Oscillospiraceae bacterium]
MNVTGKVKVEICGKTYTLITREDEAYVADLAKRITRAVDDILRDTPTLNLASALSLVCMDFADDLMKQQQSSDNLRAQIRDYVNEAGKAHMEADNLRKELADKEREIQDLKNRLGLRDLRNSID